MYLERDREGVELEVRGRRRPRLRHHLHHGGHAGVHLGVGPVHRHLHPRHALLDHPTLPSEDTTHVGPGGASDKTRGDRSAHTRGVGVL